MDNKKYEELQSRREFFKSAAKVALPVIGAVVLSQLPLTATAGNCICTGNCSNGCYNGCHRSCGASCGLKCQGVATANMPGCSGCSGTCHSCTGYCSGNCAGSCIGLGYTVYA